MGASIDEVWHMVIMIHEDGVLSANRHHMMVVVVINDGCDDDGIIGDQHIDLETWWVLVRA